MISKALIGVSIECCFDKYYLNNTTSWWGLLTENECQYRISPGPSLVLKRTSQTLERRLKKRTTALLGSITFLLYLLVYQ